MQAMFDYRAMGRRVRECRSERGMTQEMLAEKAGISTSFIGHIERGEKQASVDTVVTLSQCLNVSLDYLLMGRKRFLQARGLSIEGGFAEIGECVSGGFIIDRSQLFHPAPEYE